MATRIASPRGPDHAQTPDSHRRLLAAIGVELLQRDPDGRRADHIDDPQQAARTAVDRAFDSARLWDEHLGGFYDVDGVRALLGAPGRPVSKQAVSKRAGLLALRTGSGRVVYPAFQFSGGRPVAGLAAVLDALPPEIVSRWTVASWLVSPQAALDGDRPIDVLAEGHPEPVVRAARDWAGALAA